ncbi:MAG: hypothetical protein IPG93_03205 [Burkholderiales bacterium]|nr:hypothetical protein [Burkholderiales bacterium]
MKTRKLAHAAILAAGFLAAPLFVAACPVDQAKPFTAGPIMQQPAEGTWTGPFSEWVVDSNGVGLQICTDSVDGLGNPPPCFYDPVDPASPYSAALNRGGEAFWFLADSVFDTVDATGAQALRAVIVMGAESAFLSDPPAPGFETQFQRLRTRIDVAQLGVYYVETPWGKRRYVVDTLLPPGNGQNRSEISEPIDITFAPGPNAGLITPFLIADNRGGVDPAQYIGDGLTPTTVTGSPCGENWVKVTAFAPDDATPIDINGGSNVLINRQFTVFGKIAPAAAVPLSVDAAYYTRTGGNARVNTIVVGSTSTSAEVTAAIAGAATPTVTLARDGARFFASTPVTSVPATIAVTTTDGGRPSTPNVQSNIAVKDLVTITSAVATCSAGTGCLLTVNASSSDDGSGPSGAPVLTLVNNNTPLTNGVAATNAAAVPGVVTVRSAFGGQASKPVTIVNQ